jgi:SAM-dependent methyltransferase
MKTSTNDHMNDVSQNISRYLAGDYKALHPGWHAEDAPMKARDLLNPVRAVILDMAAGKQGSALRLADVGAGVGLVLAELMGMIHLQWPEICITPTAFEISPEAAAMAKARNPGLDVRQKLLAHDDGPFDAALLVDVLEHVENPWDLLRTVHSTSEYLVVRQPLLGNFSRFRHDNYRDQRMQWGHIGYFNYRSFLDMTAACGWQPIHLNLLAPWELAANHLNRGGLGGRLFLKLNRVMASFFVDGFYLNGAFRRTGH